MSMGFNFFLATSLRTALFSVLVDSMRFFRMSSFLSSLLDLPRYACCRRRLPASARYFYFSRSRLLVAWMRFHYD